MLVRRVLGKMELDYWHYRNWEAFKKKIYGNTLNPSNFFDDGRIHHQENYFQISEDGLIREYSPPNIDDTHFIKLVKGNEFYILPKRFIKQFPIIPKETIEFHLKKSETQVWKFILSIDSLSIPVKQCYGYREFITRWNPIKHENEMTNTFLKFIALSKGVKLGICGEVGSGKNSNLTLLRQMKPNIAPKVKTPTRAKFYRTLYYNEYINLDEITSWKNSEVSVVEDLVAEMGDEAPEFDKFSLDKNRSMETISNANDKSLTFTFNPPSRDNPHTFNEKFNNYDKIKDRYPVFYVKGKVLSSVKRPTEKQSIINMEKNFKEMCDLVSTEGYYKQELDKHLHHWSRDRSQLLRRFKNNLSPLLDVIDMYCISQLEFNVWIDFMNKTYNDFLNIEQPTKEQNSILDIEEVDLS